MKKAFFGGSFDPPHYGHLGVARAALASGKCDHVVWFPASTPPHKLNYTRAPFNNRMEMVALLIKDIPEMSVSDFEEKIDLHPSYTIDVLAELKKLHGEDYALLIGADSLLALHTWHEAEKLADTVELITYPRRGAEPSLEKLMEFWPEKTARKLLDSVIPGTFFEISSTMMKNSMEKYGFRHHIIEENGFPPEIAGYIQKNRLYKAADDN
jgi:nicotinate-nucleotide adenylyltransferase